MVLNDLATFAKKALEELMRMKESTVSNLLPPEEPHPLDLSEIPQMEFNGVNLLNLGGATDSEKARRVAVAIWGEEALKSTLIGAKRRRAGGREPADGALVKTYKSAVKLIFGERYTDELYTSTLRLVNQWGLDQNKPKTAVDDQLGETLDKDTPSE